MRDPNRIEQLLTMLGEAWHKWPDQRFGQFLLNFYGMCACDVWQTEDDEWLAGLQAFIGGKNPKEVISEYTAQKYTLEKNALGSACFPATYT